MSDDEFDDIPASRRTSKKIVEEDDEFDDHQPIDATESTNDPKGNIDNIDVVQETRPSEKISIDVAESSPAASDYHLKYNPIKKRRIIKKHSSEPSRRRDLTEDDSSKQLSASEPVDSQGGTSNIDSKTGTLTSESNSTADESSSIERLAKNEEEPVLKRTETDSAAKTLIPEVPQLVKPAWMTDEMWNEQQEKVKQSLGLAKPTSTAPETEGDSEDSTDNIKRPKRRSNKEEQMRQAEEFLRREEEKETKIVERNLANYQNMSQDEIIKFHYNQQTFASKRQKRTESKIYKLRSFNNCIKYILIHKFAKQFGNVLDLGCGKGGDMAKWESIQTKSYAGIDLSDQSIREAINRYRGSRYDFHAVFATGDAFNLPVNDILEAFKDQISFEFDTVSMQFCLHYAFESEKTVRSLLTNISNSLKVGGMFIGTIPSSDFIRWKISKLPPNEKKWGNSIYSVDFQKDPPRDGVFRPPFGQVYNYFLQDAVDNVPEFVVPFELFRSLCEEYNLELRYKKNFVSMFNTEIPNMYNLLPRPLLQSMKREDGSYGVNGDDKDACSFYLAFAFEKVGYQ